MRLYALSVAADLNPQALMRMKRAPFNSCQAHAAKQRVIYRLIPRVIFEMISC